MTYVTDIPVSGESLGSTRDRVRGNFQEIAVVEAVNHVAFNATGKGKHKFLQMPEQVSAPATLVNEAGFYSKVGPNPAQTNLFFRAEDSAGTGGFEYQLTRAIEASTALFATNTAYTANHAGGWTFLPGNLILQYGLRTSIGANSTATVTFPVAFTTACFSVSLAPVTSGNPTSQMIVNANPGTANFVINNNSSTFTRAFWIAIGI